MARNGSRNPHRFDAFVSYSREDESFAGWLETKLERYRPPRFIGSSKRMHIFRDIPDLIGSTLSDAIVDALGRSEHLIVVCSPSARGSAWVNREIEVFSAANGPENIIPVLLKGRPNNEAASDEADKAFPPALEALYEDPLSADFRTRQETRSERSARRREALFFVLARLLNVEKEALIRRQRRRTVRVLGLAIAALTVLTIAFAMISFEAIKQRDDARNQMRIATSRRLAAQAFTNLDDQLDLALLLGSQAQIIDSNPDALGSMLAGLAQSPTLITYLRGHTGRVLDLAFDARGERLASASSDGTIRIWDVATGRQSKSVLRGHEGGVLKIHFSPDGRRLVSVGDDKTIHIWNARSLVLENSVSHSHPESVSEVAITSDGERLAVAGRFRISLWDLTEGRPLGSPFRDDNQVITYSLAFSPDGKLLVSGNGDNNDMIRVWDVATRRLLEPFVGTTASSLAFSPDSRRLASGVRNIHVWDVKTRQQVGRRLVGHGADVRELVFSADGEYLASVSNLDRTLRFWNLKQQRALGQPLRGFGTSTLAISNDGRLMAAGGDDGTISLWSTERWDFRIQHRLARLLEHRGLIWSLTFSRNGAQLVTGDDDGNLQLWDVATNVPVGKPIPAAEGKIFRQVFDPKGRVLALAGHGFVTLWDFFAGESLGRIQHGERQHIPAVAFSPDGRILATGGMDATIRLWDVETRQLIAPSLHGHKTTVLSIAFSPDGKRMASASGGGTIRLWDTKTFKALAQPLHVQESAIIAVFIPDDDRLIAVSEHAIHRWRLPGREVLRTLRMNQTPSPATSSAALGPDGRQLAILRSDGTIQIWDLKSELPISEALPQNEVLGMGFPAWGTLAFSPDGKLLASKGGQNKVRIWDVDVARWHRAACGIVNRNLSLLEWERFLGSALSYCRICPELPSGDGASEDAPQCTEWN